MKMRFVVSSRRFSLRCAAILCAFAAMATPVFTSACRAQGSTPEARDGFKLQDNLGRTWRNEIVTFALSPADLLAARAGRVLAGPDGKATPYQLITEGANTKIAFVADLDAWQSRVYKFSDAVEKPATDLKIEEGADAIRLTNGQTGISIRKTLANGQGPISGVLQASGKWVADSSLTGKDAAAIAGYSASVVARGPVFLEVLCRAQSAENKSWEMRVRVPSGAPVVLVEENFGLESDANLSLNFSTNFSPDHVFYRTGNETAQRRFGVVSKWRIAADPEPVFVLAPWLVWWEREREGNWFGLYSDTGSDLLAVAALNAGVWGDRKSRYPLPRDLKLTQTAEGLTMDFPLRDGRRRWMIQTLDKEKGLSAFSERAALHAATGQVQREVTPLPQKLLIQYGDFPLNLVKDQMSFAASTQGVEHPRLFVTKAQLPAIRKTFKVDAAKLEQFRREPLTLYNLDGPVSYFLATGDAELGKNIAQTAVRLMQESVDQYLHQDEVFTLGFAPHRQVGNLVAMNLVDAVIDTPAVSPEMRARLQNQIAFLGYTVSRDDYWAPALGYSANPNMTSTVAAYQTIAGAMIPNHPDSKTWMKRGLGVLYDDQLKNWADENGGWYEAPHYALVAYDYLLGSFLAAKNAGMPQYLDDPKMRKIASWMAQVSTPNDARILNRRHFPPIGNTLYHDLTGVFGIAAGVWKEKDPAFASHMQWMFKEQGGDPTTSLGGLYPTLVGYQTILTDPAIPAKAPGFTSTLFPKTGVVMRNKYPSERESFLHLIAGDNHSHYDDDSGSVVIWGKGRVVADDFGYEGYMPSRFHNMVTSLGAPENTFMHVDLFTPGAQMDYVRGKKKSWTRQIAFVKGDAAGAPEYYVLADDVRGAAPATWRMWLIANDVQISERGAVAIGTEDVDTEIYFANAAMPKLSTEQHSSSTIGLDSKGVYGKTTPTMTGLIADANGTSVPANFHVVMFPRLKTEKPATFSSLANGKVIKVQSGGATDYVLLSADPFKFEGEGIKFEGTSGLVRIKGGKAQLSLGADGRLSALGQCTQKGDLKIEANAAVNLVENGDFQSGEQSVFFAPPESDMSAVLHESDPAPGAKDGAAKSYNVAFALKKEGTGVAWMHNPLSVDQSKIYRVHFKIYSPDKVSLQASSYAISAKDPVLKNAAGEVWTFDLLAQGPTDGWSTLETTLGPIGSNAKFQWPAGTEQINLTIRVAGKSGTLYMDDVSIEPIETPK